MNNQIPIIATYDAAFFAYVNSGAIKSAERVLPVLISELDIRSVLDVGCGQGAWLSVWMKFGVRDVVGIDGDYVNEKHLLIPKQCFVPLNLAISLNLGRRFDLVQSLEVAEHLPPSSAAGFIDSLVAHGDLVLFSAAAKGQGGHHHINEQSYDYWRELFSAHGYVPLDYLRPRILADKRIEPWYRYNSVLYASKKLFSTLPEIIQASRIADDKKIPDVSPLTYRLRKAIVRLLPEPIVTVLAKIKERCVAGARAMRERSINDNARPV